MYTSKTFDRFERLVYASRRLSNATEMADYWHTRSEEVEEGGSALAELSIAYSINELAEITKIYDKTLDKKNGKPDKKSSSLLAFLHFMLEETEDNNTSETLKQLIQKVDAIQNELEPLKGWRDKSGSHLDIAPPKDVIILETGTRNKCINFLHIVLNYCGNQINGTKPVLEDPNTVLNKYYFNSIKFR